MRSCTRCGATYATGVLFCPQDGASTVELPVPARESPRPSAPPPAGSGVVVAGLPAASPAAARSTPPSDPFIGKMVGNFRLNRRIGSGGMGAVYEGVHPIIGSRVAVKLLGGSFALEKDLVDRFFAEARTLNQVDHQNIVKVIDLGAHPEGFYYCIMELLEGDTLSNVMLRSRVDLIRAVRILVQACDALAAAHDKGIIHRDLKPANIMLVRSPATGAELVKLVDFGIAKLQSAQTSAAHATVTGTVIGTPAYMSPEQASGRVSEIDPRSDLYSLGLVGYELITGRHPFEGKAVGELIVAQMTEHPPPPSRLTSLPRQLDDAVMRLLRKRKDDRFPTAAAAGAEFRVIFDSLRGEPTPVSAPPPVRAITPPSLPPVPSSAPNIPRMVAAPAAVSSPPSRREATVNQTTGRIRLAARKPPRKALTARPWFIVALALAGVVFGAVMVGLFDAEPMVASAAAALGLAPPPPRVRSAAPPSLDGTPAAFAAAPALLECKDTFTKLRGVQLPGDAAVLKEHLVEKLGEYNKLEECITARKPRLAPPKLWAASYVMGVAAFEFAVALDHLSPSLRKTAAGYTVGDSKMSPFSVQLFGSQAVDRLNDARLQAPDVQRAFIDNFQIELDALKQRERAEVAQPAPTTTQAAAARPGPATPQ